MKAKTFLHIGLSQSCLLYYNTARQSLASELTVCCALGKKAFYDVAGQRWNCCISSVSAKGFVTSLWRLSEKYCFWSTVFIAMFVTL